MKKLISLMGMALAITGCQMNASSGCEIECACTMRKDVVITYGDSIISVKPNTKPVRKGWNFRVRLEPDDAKYTNKKVQIRAEDERETWLTGHGNFAVKDTFKICVPAQDPRIRVGAVFPYSVSVQDVGVLDPRVKVID